MYIHIPKEKRTKLDHSGRKGIFMGYSESLKAYRIYFPRFKKIDISMDVTFDEDQLTTNLERGLLKNLRKLKHLEFMTQP